MRILLTADAELPVPPKLYGGIERVIDLLVKEFLKAGHEVGLVAHPDTTAKTTAFFSWLGISSTNRKESWSNAMTLRRAVKEFKPDVVHSFSRLLWLLPLIHYPFSSIHSPPLVMSYQREPTGRTVRWSNALHRGRLQFTGCSEYICRNGRERGGGKWTAIPNAVDLASYTFQPKVADDAPLVFLSRIEPIKGCHTAIEIAKRSHRRLLIAGNHSDEGTLGAYWREKILPEMGRNGIEYVGAVNDQQKNELLGQAAAMVVPIEWNEPFGIVFIEALACGTPVISCARGALPEIVRDGVDGFLVNGVPEGVAAVARINRLRREHCRERVEDNYSGHTVAKQYLSVYIS
jgi:glycosyltransferase involved in cell wall biosynthesis